MLYAWFHFEGRFKDFFIPDQDNWSDELLFNSLETGWENDTVIKIRSLDGSRYIQCAEGYVWKDHPGTIRELKIIDGMQLSMIRKGREIGVIFNQYSKEYTSFTKYSFTGEQKLGLGREKNNDIQMDNPRISANHGYFLRTGDGSCDYIDQSKNGSYINGGLIIGQSCHLSFGDVIAFVSGLKIVFLRDALAINHPTGLINVNLPSYTPHQSQLEKGDGATPSAYIQYHRAPRLLKKADLTAVDIEAPLPKSNQSGIPLLLTIGPSMTMVLPMIMGSAMSGSGSFVSAGLAMIGTSSLLAVSWGLVNARYRKHQGELSETARVSLYARYVQEMEAQLQSLNDKEKMRLLDSYPNHQQCLNFAETRSLRLWERTPAHHDFLHLRLGLGDVSIPNPFTTGQKKLSIIDDPLRDEPKKLINKHSVVDRAPIAVSLREEALMGVLGKSKATALTQGLIMQLAALHSYHEVKIVILTDENERSLWEWAKWLPHVFPGEDRQLRMIASKPAAIHKVLSYLDDVMMLRAETIPAGENETSATPLPHIILICTSPQILDNHPFMRHILQRRLGISLIMLAPSMELLPKECRLIVNAEEIPASLYITEGDIRQFHLEYPDARELERFSRSIAPIRVKDTAENTAIPTMVTFLDLYNVRRVEELDVWRFWNENHAYEGLRSVIGLRSGSQPFVLDISDKYHGPHGLVAGTTGSGKSVMLQTYILSLALNYSPRQVQFILIDYKGGGMADVFKNLVHVAGSIDNLQGERTILRALASVQGEIRRRESIFRRVGVSNIDEYIRLFNSEPSEEPLAHLIIIVDEFAELKKEQPEFMHELVSTSRVGRSVGLHLILATQKPSNSVDDEIWSNTRFRICLRVQGRSDSMDMLKRPDAAYIKGMGRCYVQVGNDEIFDQVQTSWSGAAYLPDELRPDEMPHLLDDSGQPVLVKRKKPRNEARVNTQMDAVLDWIQKTAKEHGETLTRRLWLDEMRTRISLQEIERFSNSCFNGRNWPTKQEGLATVVGIADDLTNQKHMPVVIDLEKNRNYIVVGMSGSGKTMLLQTIAVSIAAAYSPDRLQIYIFSLSSRILGCLESFPHVGDVIYEEEKAEQHRLIDRLTDEDEARRKLFAGAMTDSFFEYNRSVNNQVNQTVIPAIFVLIDRLSQLVENLDEGRLQKISYLLREGSNHGIFFAGSAMAFNEIPPRLRDIFHGVALQLPEISDYSEVLRKRIPYEMGKIAAISGRGMIVIEDTPYEMMTALYGEGEGDAARARQIAQLGEKMQSVWTGIRPGKVTRIPQDPKWSDIATNEGFINAQKDVWTLPLAYNAQNGKVETIRLDRHFSWLVTGAAESGKTNLLKAIALTFRERSAEIHIAGSEEWDRFAKEHGMHFINLRNEEGARFIKGLTDIVLERSSMRKKALEQGADKFNELVMGFKPIVLLIDDAEKSIPHDNPGFNQFILPASTEAGKFGIFLFMAVSHFAYQQVRIREPFASLSRQQRAIALGGRLAESNLPNIPGTYSIKNQVLPLGEAFMLNNGVLTHLVIPKVI